MFVWGTDNSTLQPYLEGIMSENECCVPSAAFTDQ